MNEEYQGDCCQEECKMEMPKYKCHKKVWALKILEFILDKEVAKNEGRETDGGAWITPYEGGYSIFKVDREYVRKHDPEVGGYYVVYEGGYKSYSPSEPFEEGYSM